MIATGGTLVRRLFAGQTINASVLIGRVLRDGGGLHGLCIGLGSNLHGEQHTHHVAPETIQHAAEHFERLAFVFLLRVFLRIAAQVNALAQQIEVRKMFAPLRVHHLQQNIALELAKHRIARNFTFRVVRIKRFFFATVANVFVVEIRLGFDPFAHMGMNVHVVQRRFECWNVPLLFNALDGHVKIDGVFYPTFNHVTHGIADVRVLQKVVTLLIDGFTLIVGNVVVLEELLTNVKVAGLDFELRLFDLTRHDARFNRLAIRNAQTGHDVLHPITAEDTNQRVLSRQVEATRSSIALPSSAAAQLVIDTARLMPLSTHDAQAASSNHFVVKFLPVGLYFRHTLLALLWRERLIFTNRAKLGFERATEHDVRTAARHVGSDGDDLRQASLRHDVRFALVLLRVQNLMR